MSDPVASHITMTLTTYDKIVRDGLRDGDILVKLLANYPDMRSFYKKCSDLIEPQQKAAFQASFFLHGFIRDYKTNKQSPTFLGDQRLQLALYDARKARKRLPAQTVSFQPAGTTFLKAPSPPRPSTPPRPSVPLKVVSPPTPPVAGPGPNTIQKSSKPSFKDISASPPPREIRRFRDIEDSGESDAEREDKIFVPKGKKLKVSADKDENVRTIKVKPSGETRHGSERVIRVKRNPAGMITSMDRKLTDHKQRHRHVKPIVEIKRKRRLSETQKEVSEFGSESEAASDRSDDKSWDGFDHHSKKTPPKSKTDNKRDEKPVIPTGELYDPPCSSCRIAKRPCEKQGQGSACHACRKSKQRCEFSKRKGRVSKSKTEVASADDESEGPTDVPGSRNAAKMATKAITKAIEDIESAAVPPKKRGPARTKVPIEAKISYMVERVDRLTVLVDRMSDFLGVPADYVRGESRSYADKSRKSYADKSIVMDMIYAEKSIGDANMAADKYVQTDTSVLQELPPVPNVNLVQATPVNSQDLPAGTIALHPTPPQGELSNVNKDVDSEKSAAVVIPSAAALDFASSPSSPDVPVPLSPSSRVSSISPPVSPRSSPPAPTSELHPLSRSRTPDLLERLRVPRSSPPRTRSRSRSGSPLVRADKRKAEQEASNEKSTKKARV